MMDLAALALKVATDLAGSTPIVLSTLPNSTRSAGNYQAIDKNGISHTRHSSHHSNRRYRKILDSTAQACASAGGRAGARNEPCFRRWERWEIWKQRRKTRRIKPLHFPLSLSRLGK